MEVTKIQHGFSASGSNGFWDRTKLEIVSLTRTPPRLWATKVKAPNSCRKQEDFNACGAGT